MRGTVGARGLGRAATAVPTPGGVGSLCRDRLLPLPVPGKVLEQPQTGHKSWRWHKAEVLPRAGTQGVPSQPALPCPRCPRDTGLLFPRGEGQAWLWGVMEALGGLVSILPSPELPSGHWNRFQESFANAAVCGKLIGARLQNHPQAPLQTQSPMSCPIPNSPFLLLQKPPLPPGGHRTCHRCHRDAAARGGLAAGESPGPEMASAGGNGDRDGHRDGHGTALGSRTVLRPCPGQAGHHSQAGSRRQWRWDSCLAPLHIPQELGEQQEGTIPPWQRSLGVLSLAPGSRGLEVAPPVLSLRGSLPSTTRRTGQGVSS